MGNPVVLVWHGHTLGFSLTSNGADLLTLTDTEEKLQISIRNPDMPEILLGDIYVHEDQNHPPVIEFLALNASPGIRFKYNKGDLVRPIGETLLQFTAFYIICLDNTVKAVMVVSTK